MSSNLGLLVVAAGAVVGWTSAHLNRRGHLTRHGFWAIGAAFMALVLWAARLYAPPMDASSWAAIYLLYGTCIITCTALAVRGWREANRPGWYGGQHERIDNP